MNVLIIEDEKIIAGAITRVLTSAGHRVFTHENGFDVISRINETDPVIIFLDVKMPGRSGLDVLREIKEHRPEVRVVMMSGYTSPENTELARQLGADDFLKKPFDDIFEIQRIVERNI